MNTKILFIFRANTIGQTGITKYFDELIIELKEKGYSIDILYNCEKYSYYLTFLRMITIDPLVMFFKSKQYDEIIVTSDFLTNYIMFCPKKASVVFHHLKQEIESNLSDKKFSLTDSIIHMYRIYTHHRAKKCKRIIFPSKHTRRDFLNLFGNISAKDYVIFNPFNINKFRIVKSDKQSLFEKYNITLSQNTKYLLYVGTEAIRKNFITLLKTMKCLPSNYHLIKIGLPRVQQNRDKHTQYTKEHNLPVTFIDYVDDQDLVDFYHACDVYVNPSLFEGFGRTPIEAQACGLPVISTTCGALAEVLDDSAYLINHPEDPNCFSQAIINVCNDDLMKKSLIIKGYENLKRFSLEKQVNQWDQLLKT